MIIGSVVASLSIAFALFYLARRRQRLVRLRSKADGQESSDVTERQEVGPVSGAIVEVEGETLQKPELHGVSERPELDHANGAIVEVEGETLPQLELHGRSFERYEVDGGIHGHNEAEGSSTFPLELEAGRSRGVELPCTRDSG